MNITLYHNPRCSKSREALKLLNDQGLEPGIVEYLKTPPTRKDLEQLVNMLGIHPRDLMRTREDRYKELGLDNPGLSADQLIDALAANPSLLERPIAVANGRAVIGRPPEKVLEIARHG